MKDRGMAFIDSGYIESIEPLDPINFRGVETYRQFLQSQCICYNARLLQGANPVLKVDRGNFDHRDHLMESGMGLFAWDFVQSHAPGRLVDMFTANPTKNPSYDIWQQPIGFPMRGHFGINGDEALVSDARRNFADIDPGPIDSSSGIPVGVSNPKTSGNENYVPSYAYEPFV